MTIKLLLFAVLRDIVGESERDVVLPDGTRALELWNMVRQGHPELQAVSRPPLTAVNQEYVSPDTELREGDEVAFIPPVSGG